MKIAHKIATGAWLLCSAALAQAQGALDPPRYDTSVLCYQRATVAEGFSVEAMTQCLAQQRKSYDAIRRRWNQLPEEIQTGCDEQTRATRVLDYQSLENCIETQLRRIPPGPIFEFPRSN
jgi:hypothetical protein